MSSGAKIALSMSAGPADVIRNPPAVDQVLMEKRCNGAPGSTGGCVGPADGGDADTKHLEALGTKPDIGPRI